MIYEYECKCMGRTFDPAWNGVQKCVGCHKNDAVKEVVERCVQAVRDYADGIERGMDADGRSPELVASFETALDIAGMLERKK